MPGHNPNAIAPKHPTKTPGVDTFNEAAQGNTGLLALAVNFVKGYWQPTAAELRQRAKEQHVEYLQQHLQAVAAEKTQQAEAPFDTSKEARAARRAQQQAVEAAKSAQLGQELTEARKNAESAMATAKENAAKHTKAHLKRERQARAQAANNSTERVDVGQWSFGTHPITFPAGVDQIDFFGNVFGSMVSLSIGNAEIADPVVRTAPDLNTGDCDAQRISLVFSNPDPSKKQPAFIAEHDDPYRCTISSAGAVVAYSAKNATLKSGSTSLLYVTEALKDAGNQATVNIEGKTNHFSHTRIDVYKGWSVDVNILPGENKDPKYTGNILDNYGGAVRVNIGTDNTFTRTFIPMHGGKTDVRSINGSTLNNTEIDINTGFIPLDAGEITISADTFEGMSNLLVLDNTYLNNKEKDIDMCQNYKVAGADAKGITIARSQGETNFWQIKLQGTNPGQTPEIYKNSGQLFGELFLVNHNFYPKRLTGQVPSAPLQALNNTEVSQLKEDGKLAITNVQTPFGNALDRTINVEIFRMENQGGQLVPVPLKTQIIPGQGNEPAQIIFPKDSGLKPNDVYMLQGQATPTVGCPTDKVNFTQYFQVNQEKSGLNAGEIAGIVIGTLSACAIAVAGLGFAYKKHQHRSQAQEGTELVEKSPLLARAANRHADAGVRSM